MSRFRLRVDILFSERTVSKEQLEWIEKEFEDYDGNKANFVRKLVFLAYKYEKELNEYKKNIENKVKAEMLDSVLANPNIMSKSKEDHKRSCKEYELEKRLDKSATKRENIIGDFEKKLDN